MNRVRSGLLLWIAWALCLAGLFFSGALLLSLDRHIIWVVALLVAILFASKRSTHQDLRAFFFLLPLTGSLNHVFHIAAVPVLMPVAYLVLSRHYWHRRQEATAWMLPLSVEIMMINLVVSLAVGLVSFRHAWLRPHQIVSVTPWATIPFTHALGWIGLAFFTTLAGILLFEWFYSQGDLALCRKSIQALLTGMVVSFFLSVMEYIHPGAIGWFWVERYNGGFIDANIAGLAAAICFNLWVGWMLAARESIPRLLVGISLIAMMILAGSRSGLIAWMIGMLVLAPQAWKFVRRKPLIQWTFTVLLIGVGLYFLPRHSHITTRSQRWFLESVDQVRHGQWAKNFEDRTDVWRAGWVVFRHRPVVGLGIGTYLVKMPFYQPEIGKIFNDNAGNMYLHIAAEQGLVGLLAFLVLIVATLRRFLQTPQCDLLQAGAFAALVAILMAMLVGAPLLNFEVQCLFWLLLAVLRTN